MVELGLFFFCLQQIIKALQCKHRHVPVYCSGVELDDLQWSLPIQTILWSYDCVSPLLFLGSGGLYQEDTVRLGSLEEMKNTPKEVRFFPGVQAAEMSWGTHQIHRIPKLESAHRGHWIQPLAPHSTNPNSKRMSESRVQTLPELPQPGAMNTALRNLFQGPTTLWWRTLS